MKNDLTIYVCTQSFIIFLKQEGNVLKERKQGEIKHFESMTSNKRAKIGVKL